MQVGGHTIIDFSRLTCLLHGLTVVTSRRYGVYVRPPLEKADSISIEPKTVKVGEFSCAVDEAFIEEVGAGLPDALARSTELCFEGTDIAPEAAIFLTELRELVLIVCDSLRTQSGYRNVVWISTHLATFFQCGGGH